MSIKSTDYISRPDAIKKLAYVLTQKEMTKIIHDKIFELNSLSNETLGDLMDEYIADNFTNYIVNDDGKEYDFAGY